MNAQALLYVFTTAPYSNANGQEALDSVLVGAAFEQEVSVLFVHDGVFQLKAKQDTSSAQIKQYTKAFKALDDFGVENVYVHDLSLLARGVDETDLIINAKIIDAEKMRNLIAKQFRVFTF